MSADLVLTNGNIHTMDAALPRVEAVAIAGEQIIGIGNSEAMRALLADGGRAIDLDGCTVTPGFIDAHLHFLSYGLSLAEIDLMNVPSLATAQERVAARAAEAPAGQWLTGRGWDQVFWEGQQFPSKTDLDAVTPDHPAFLRRKCGHAGWANSRALALADINAETPDPPGGEIVRDPETGEPTGILLENAMNLISALIAEPTDAEAVEAVKLAQRKAHELGIVGVHNMEAAPALRAYQELRRRGELKLRILQQIPESELDAAIEIGLQSGFGDEWIRIGALKIFSDGSLGARSALMVEAYEDEPDNFGIAVSTAEHLKAQIEKASRAGLAVYIHAIGDQANRNVLDAIEATRDCRHRPAPAPSHRACTDLASG